MRRACVSRVDRPARRGLAPAEGTRPLLVVALVGSLFFAPLAGPAAAAPSDGTPTSQDVRQAQDREARARRDVGDVQAALALANSASEASAVRAAQAFEDYNGARFALQEARETLRRARAEARVAGRRRARQRDRLAGLVSADYQQGSDLSVLDALAEGQGPQGLMTHLLALDGATSSTDAQRQKFAATAVLAEVFREEAARARERQQRALARAETARQAAVAAAATAERTAGAIAAEKDRLVRELAELQGISLALSRQRQRALEARERERAAVQASAGASTPPSGAAVASPDQGGASVSPPPAPGPQQPQVARPAPAQPEPDATAPAPQPPAPAAPAGHPQPAPEPSPAPPSPPPPLPPAPQPAPAPATSGGAASAVAFARAQLGEPYVWAAAGPNAWDCSGLTMMAWRAGGVSLPHYSVAQYAAATPITSAQLRVGDLVFWGAGSSPSSIYHVALYAGGGMIIHAPRTGRPVSLESMYSWAAPTFFGRV